MRWLLLPIIIIVLFFAAMMILNSENTVYDMEYLNKLESEHPSLTFSAG
jgi:hypothetical protein